MSRRTLHEKTHRTADRAMSPVIGVVLMVAITVVLAGAIGAFVFGLTPTDQSTTPVANLAFEVTDDDNVTISHEGGEPIELADTTLLLDGNVDETFDPNATLRSGGQLEVDPTWDSIAGELVLRHDPSGEILARRTVA